MKTLRITQILLAVILLATTMSSCKDDDKDNPTPAPKMELIKLGETTLTGMDAKAEVYAKDSFTTGLNTVYIKLVDPTTGDALSSGELMTNPMMDMGHMKHSCPIENKTSTLMDGYYKTMVYFIMPGSADQWTLNFSFTSEGKTGTGSAGVKVTSSNPKRMIVTKLPMDNDATVFITLIDTGKFMEGLNDFELVIHKRESMMSFPAEEKYTVEIEPEMPSMGHGSSGNVNPVHMSNGHYKGKVHFSMGGAWIVNIKLLKDGKVISDDQHFEMEI